jgi:hypothetical protein
MKSYNSKVFSTVEGVTLIESKFSLGSKISINCQYGLYSVNQNGYISNTRYQWNYLPTKLLEDKNVIDRNSPPTFLVNCSNIEDSKPPLIFANYQYNEVKRFKINDNEILTVSTIIR